MMDVVVYAGWGIYLWSIVYAWWQGGSPERWVGTVLFFGAIATIAVREEWSSRYFDAEHRVMVVDTLVLAAMALVALRAHRSWPVLVVSLHAMSTASHWARLLDTAASETIYAIMATLSGYTVPLVVIGGTMAHRRRLKRDGADPSWSRFWWPPAGIPTGLPFN